MTVLLLTAVVCLVPGAGISQGGPNRAAPALAAYDRIASVLQGPRCLNCHPRGDRPTQGDDRHTHLMNVQRGPDGNGVPAMHCSACHQTRNNEMAGIPGAPHWHLAPASMGWAGLRTGELCRTLLDRSNNGGRSVPQLIAHITGDELVGWAWQPGGSRSPPALAMDELKTALADWARGGAPCPQ